MVDENVIKVLVGHEKEFTMKHYGGDPFSPERLLEEISKVSYSGINWNGLKIQKNNQSPNNHPFNKC